MCGVSYDPDSTDTERLLTTSYKKYVSVCVLAELSVAATTNSRLLCPPPPIIQHTLHHVKHALKPPLQEDHLLLQNPSWQLFPMTIKFSVNTIMLLPQHTSCHLSQLFTVKLINISQMFWVVKCHLFCSGLVNIISIRT